MQNNRIKSNQKPGRVKGHKRSAPTVTRHPDEIIKVSKVATCTCGCKTVEQENVARDLISIKVITHTTQVERYKLQGKKKFEKEEYEEAKEKYLSILENGRKNIFI